jgi:SAM-dependent methyltransferase
VNSGNLSPFLDALSTSLASSAFHAITPGNGSGASVQDVSTTPSYKDDLRRAYDIDVERRGAMSPATWRTRAIDRFLDVATEQGAESIIELGCGTGQLARYVSDKGFDVTATDLSPANVAQARSLGLSAKVADFGSLPYADNTFEAAFAMNSLLHVPPNELGGVLTEIARVLVVGAPLLIVVWGGVAHEGPVEDEWLDPPRYFCFYTDEAFLALETPGFERWSFETLDVDEEGGGELHPQVLTLKAI